jgi:hypothetical protein
MKSPLPYICTAVIFDVRLIGLTVDADRTKKPKLPKKRILKKINRR